MFKSSLPRLAALTILVSQLIAEPRFATAQVVGAASPVVAKSGAAEAAERRKEAFEIVWQTVKDYHFDPTFGGVDWDAVKTEFAPRVAAAQSDRELHWLLQRMLNRLGKSHFAVIPPESIPAVPDEDEGDADEANGAGDDAKAARKKPTREGLDITERMTHGVGIDLRVIGGAVVITRVDHGSTAERAGLRMGFVVKSVDGVLMSTILRRYAQAEVFEPALRHQLAAEILFEYFDGEPNTSVRVGYLDARNLLRRTVVPREKLRGEMSTPLKSFPPQFVEFESKRLRGGVGYIRFNVFAVPVLEKFCAALREMSDAPAVVIDLRGNRGGVLTMIQGMGSLLATRDAIFGEMRTREGGALFRIAPARHPYRGALAVLIDEESQSASEMFASGLQESGRAVLVGSTSAGATLPSVAKELPTGAILQYAFADFVSPYGRVLEGQGVRPDIATRLDRRSLLAGRDPQLEAALAAVTPGASTTAPTYNQIDLPDDAGSVASGRDEGAGGNDATTVDPQVEQIIEKYLQAIGGRAAIEKITSRVSTGTFEGIYSGVPTSGAVEIDEKAPDKSVTIINVQNVGSMRRGFTGAYGYEQFALMGFRELKGAELDAMRVEADFRRDIDLRRLYPKMILKGTERVGDAEAYVVEATPARGLFPTKFYFDTQTGLLLRQDAVYFEDYREVDGVRVAFRIRSPLVTIKLKDVKHNVPLDDATFAERKDCFTQ
jgi:carboxyl-terminal processing protease